MTDMIVDAQPGVPVIAQIEQSTLSTVVLRSLSGEAGTMLVLSNVADHERRRFGRISHAVPVTVEATGGGPSYQGRCRDISAAGLMITDATSSGGESLNPQLGERYFVAVDAGPDRVLAVATVVGTVGAVSLRFEAISETYRGALVKLIADTTNRHD